MQTEIGMPMSITRNRVLNNLPILILGLLTAVYLSYVSPLIEVDSVTYINFSSRRPPIYPFFLWIFHGFGSYQFTIVIWFQFIFSFLSLGYACHWLRTRLQLNEFLISFILISTVVLIFIYYKMLRSICSEGITFPLFIIAFLLLVETFNHLTLKKMVLLSLYTSLLVLTRAQFYFFYILLAMLVIWNIWKKTSLKTIFLSFLLIITSIVFNEGITRSYHYLMFGRFSSVPLVGIQLIPRALFLSHIRLSQYFTDQSDQIIFEKILNRLENKHLTKSTAPEIIKGLHPVLAYYNAAVPAIEKNYSPYIEGLSLYQTNEKMLRLSKVLYLNNLKENLILYLWSISSYFGEIPFILSFLLVLFVLYKSIFKNKKIDTKTAFIILAMSTIIINVAFCAIWVIMVASYYYYTYFLTFCLAAIIANEDNYWK